MPKLNLDTTGIDPTSTTGITPYEGPVPKPGTYLAEIRQVRLQLSKNTQKPMFRTLFILAGDTKDAAKHEYRGCPIFEYITTGDSEMEQTRLAQFTKVISGKQKAIVDHDEIDDGGVVNKIGGKVPVGVHFKVVVGREPGQNPGDDPRPRISDMFAVPKGTAWPTAEAPEAPEEAEEADEDVADDAPEDEAEDEAEDAEEAEEDAEDEDEAEEEDEDDGSARMLILSEMNRVALKKELVESNPDFKVLKKHTDDELREAIMTAEFGEAEEEDGDEPPF